MFHKFTLFKFAQTLIILIIGTQLLACGGGGGGSGSSASGTESSVADAPVVNTAPVISGSPSGSVTANAGYWFKPGASDADGDPLTFSIRNKPVWASFSTGSGRLSGTPSNSHVGPYSNIKITVNDGSASASLGPFSITVSNANEAPVITGSPATSVAEGNLYFFRPKASDANGDDLTFRIKNRPSWASFNGGTGRLSGTPGNSDVGSYSNIVITVTDGTKSVSLQAFSIQVSKAVLTTGSFSVGWAAPVMRSDGTPLSLADINGYRLYYGTSSGSYPYVAEVSDGAATAVTVTGVPLGTSYVVMTTYDEAGRESIYSREISKIVR